MVPSHAGWSREISSSDDRSMSYFLDGVKGARPKKLSEGFVAVEKAASVFQQRFSALVAESGEGTRKVASRLRLPGKEKPPAAQTILNWMEGETEPTVSTILDICRIYGVSPNYLLGWEEKPFPFEIKESVRILEQMPPVLRRYAVQILLDIANKSGVIPFDQARFIELALGEIDDGGTSHVAEGAQSENKKEI